MKNRGQRRWSDPLWLKAVVLVGAVYVAVASPVDAQSPAPESITTPAAATANPAATKAALEMLRLGGSVADAAIAAQMVLGVVEPQSSGLGGGTVVLYRQAGNGQMQAFDGLARSPAGYQPADAASASFEHSGAAVGAPGTLRLLGILHSRYGKLPWATLFEPAIELADRGYPAPPYLARSLSAAIRAGFAPPEWLKDATGGPVREGMTIKNPELAATMRKIAQNGPDALYVGMATRIAAAVHNSPLAGTLGAEDLAAYQPVERMPLCTEYHAMTLCAFPPPSYGGVAVLELLGILDRVRVPAADFLHVDFVHAFAEAGRIAEADRLDVVGDPDGNAPSVQALLDPSYLDQRAKLISLDRTIKDPISGGSPRGLSRPHCTSRARPSSPSTTQVVIVDGSGAALSMTSTINVNFGSWLAVGGFFLNNAMTNFSLTPDAKCTANAPAPNKRPETAMVPVMGTDVRGNLAVVGGSAGAGEIVDYVAQALFEIVDGSPVMKAVDEGHVSTARAPYSDSRGLVELEQGRSITALAEALKSLGHPVKQTQLQSGLSFLARQGGIWSGAADPRRDGDWGVAR